MATIISFPADQRAQGGRRAAPAEPGTVIILPVIRVDRSPDEPSGGLESNGTAGRKRRRRALLKRDNHGHTVLRTRPRSAIAFCIPIIGCLNTDFGRVRPSLLNDDIHSWMGPVVAERHDEGESTFRLTEGERLMRDLGYPLIEPPFERQRWYSVLNEYGRSGLFQPNWFIYDERAYARDLLDAPSRTVDALYSRLIDDIRNDITRVPPFVTAARSVMDMDKRRDQSLRFIRELNPAEHGNAVARMGENLLIMRWVNQSLNERVIGYQYALERLVISSPTMAAAEAERQLTLLKLRVADTRLFPAQPQPLPIALKGGPAPRLVTK